MRSLVYALFLFLWMLLNFYIFMNMIKEIEIK